MARVIVHIDLNAFFVRCEEIKDPSLEGKAVAIGTRGRAGIVSTCSYKARSFGVCSGMPMFKAIEKCPHLIIIPGDYRFYRALSDTFMKFVRLYTPLVEIASIDECYADFTEVVKSKKDKEAFFKELQTSLYNKTKLRCSIGVGPSKFLAKMGSDYRKPMGLTIIRRKDIPTLLYPLGIEKMFGIGKKSTPKLKAMGINTIGELATALEKEDPKIISFLGKFAATIKLWLSGYGDDKIITEPEDYKSIGHSTTLPYDTSDIDVVLDTLKQLSHQVSERTKKHALVGQTVQVTAKETAYNGFKVHNKSITLTKLTNKFEDIYSAARKLYEDSFTGLEVRLVGVALQNTRPIKEAKIQMSLFDFEEHEKENKTFLIIDELNHKLNKPSLIRASELKEHKDGNK